MIVVDQLLEFFDLLALEGWKDFDVEEYNAGIKIYEHSVVCSTWPKKINF